MTKTARGVVRAIGYGLEVTFALVGGVACAIAVSLVVLFFARIEVFTAIQAAGLIIIAAIGSVIAALVRRRVFGCLAVPVLELFSSDESDTSGPRTDLRVVAGVVAVFVTFASLFAAVLTKATTPLVIGVVAFGFSVAIALRLSAAITHEMRSKTAQPGATDNPDDAQ